MKVIRHAGITSVILDIFVQNTGATDGSGLTGLVFNSASMVAYYKRDVGTAATAITLANITTIGTWANNGFREVDAANMPGVYEFDPPDAAFAAGAKSVVFMLKGATNMAPVVLEVQLIAMDLNDSVRGGMTALPNANAEAAGGLYTRGAGAGQINQPASGRIDTNPVTLAGTTLTGRDIGAGVLVADKTGWTVALTNAQGLKKNTARKLYFALYDSTGAPKTGVSVTAERALDGATSWSAATGTVAEVANGTYCFSGAAADFNCDDFAFRFSGSGAIDAFISGSTVQA